MTPPTAPERCPTCDREGCPMFPTPPVHEEEPRDKCPGCVAMYDCDAHRRARKEARDAAAAQWAKVAPLIERLRGIDAEANARGTSEDRLRALRSEHFDAVRTLLSAAEATP